MFLPHAGEKLAFRCRILVNNMGWSGGAMVPIWIMVGQGPTALAVGAGGVCLNICSLIYHFSLFFLPLPGRQPDID